MKKYLAIACMLLPFSTYAQTRNTLPLSCAEPKAVLKVISEEYGELPTWVGSVAESGISAIMFVNEDTKTWSFILKNNENTCLVVSGSSSMKVTFPKKGPNL